MKGRTCVCAALIAVALPGLIARPANAEKGGSAACFDRIKSLTGDWVAKEPKTGKEFVALRYRVISGGSAVEEIEEPGTQQEMVTVYFMDGGALRMTHYCMLRNQPQMKATAESTPDKIVFQCSGGTGMKSHNDTHMHALTITTPDKDHMAAEWTLSVNGKPTEPVKFIVQRKQVAPQSKP